MAKTVAAAAIGITADTTSARNELSHIRRILRETQEPTQKLEADIGLLEKRINSSEQADEALIAALEKKRAELQRVRAETQQATEAQRQALAIEEMLSDAVAGQSVELAKQNSQLERNRQLSMEFGSAEAYNSIAAGSTKATAAMGKASGSLSKMVLESTLATRAASALGISTSTLATGGIAALGAALPVAYVGMNKLTAAALDQVDQQDDLARILGVSYNELKQFEFALSLAGGVSAGQATEGLRNLNRMVGEASLGMGKGRKIFEELGVSISDLAGMNAVEQFDAVSKAIANIEQPAARSAIAMKLFGDERIALAVGQMADQLAKAKESAKEFQLPLTDQQIQTAKELNDQMQQIAAVWNSFKVGAFALIGDTLIRINKELLTFATNLSSAKDSFFNFFGIKTSGQIAEMQRQIDEMNRQAEAAGKRVQTQGELEAQAAAQLQEELAGIAAAQDEVFKNQQASLQFRKDELNYGKRLAEINKAVREGMSDKQATQFVDDMLALEEREKKQKALVDQQAKQQQAMKDFESVRRDAAMQSATEFDKVASQVRAFRTQFEGLVGGDELAQVALEKFGPAMRAALAGSIPQIQAPSLVRAGSAEAYRMTIQPQIDQMQQQIDLQGQQLAEQQASNAILQEMSSNIANIQPAQRRR
jgi:hypothetical protein